MPLITIIIPVYNVEKYLSDCLDSVINQTYKNLEIILVDDGSTDDSGKICDDYAIQDKRIIVVHKKNEGVSRARNYGLDIASGKGVCFIDSDDTIDLDYIHCFIDMWEKNDSDLFIANVRDIFEGYFKERPNLQDDLTGVFRDDYSILIDCVLRGPGAKMYKKYIIDKFHTRFPDDMSISEDQVWNFRYYSHIDTYSYCGEVFYNYFHRGIETLSNKITIGSWRDDLQKLEVEKEFLLRNNIKHYKEILTWHALEILRKYALIDDRRNSYSDFRNRWNMISEYVDSSISTKSKKNRVLLWLIKKKILLIVYVYYILKIIISGNGVRLISK